MKVARGFTLVEVLLVILVISMMAGIAVVALPNPDPSEAVRQAGQRFSDEFAIIQDRASAEQQVYGLVINDDGFAFRRVSDWRNSSGIRPPEPIWEDFESFDWQAEVSVSGRVTRGRNTPSIYILPDGFYQPEFEFSLSTPQRCTGSDFKVTGNGFNPPMVERDDC